MKVLVLGAGAREHAIAKRLHDEGARVVGAPGNAGMGQCGEIRDVDLKNVASMVDLSKKEEVELVVVGPEAPLALGVADALREQSIAVFGPTQRAAQLESSKAFAKEFMKRHRVPTAPFCVFTQPEEAEAYVRQADRPLVIKADGLAAGKGVVVADDTAQALEAIDQLMRKRAFGDAGQSVVVEERLVGPEVSFHVISDGESFLPLAPAQDHKRALDGDRGPNTGGMGAYSPPPMVTQEIEQFILSQVVEPTIRGMASEGTPLSGALFVGLMLTDAGPRVLEYNVRFGDPECEVMLARLDNPLLPLLLAAAQGRLDATSVSYRAPAAMCVVLASEGYPGPYETGVPIRGLDSAAKLDGTEVFHAGTRREQAECVTAGGRVLAVTSVGENVDAAGERAYQAVEHIEFQGKSFRRDIGWQARTRQHSSKLARSEP